MANVLVACEFSGIVRDAFTKRGHNAWSCDLLPTERPGKHYIGDVANILDAGWDIMIAHPPCTYLVPRAAYWAKIKNTYQQIEQAVAFFMLLANAPISKIAIENPVCIMSTRYRKPDQIIQPYQFGHPERKRTCLWLKNLPPLAPTNQITPEQPRFVDSKQARYFVDSISPSPERWKIRSRTFAGIAEAMAMQWD